VPAITITDPVDLYAALDQAIGQLQDYHWVMFTSANGVKHFFARLLQAGKDARALGYAKIAAIGSATAAELKKYGLVADVVPGEYRAEGIIEAMKGKLPPHAKILLPRAEEAREILPEKLREMGAEVDVVSAYRTVCAAADGEALTSELNEGRIDMVTFTSSSTVKNLVNIIGSADLLNGVKTACIGPVTADTAKSLGIEPDIIAKEYTIDGLVEAICK
jgi:uroporphyrinogen III methyltransferase/synthase